MRNRCCNNPSKERVPIGKKGYICLRCSEELHEEVMRKPKVFSEEAYRDYPHHLENVKVKIYRGMTWWEWIKWKLGLIEVGSSYNKEEK